MYGSIAHYHVKPGKMEDLRVWTEANRANGPEGGGFMIVFQMDRDPNELFAVFAAESREAYRAMSEDPATHESYLQMMEFIAADPEWNDGEIIASEFNLPDGDGLYGTISHQRVKPGKVDDLIDWNEANRPEDVPIGNMVVFQMDRDPNEIFVVIVAESEAAYRATSEDPKMHERYMQMMEFMAAEPEWHDGYVITQEIRV